MGDLQSSIKSMPQKSECLEQSFSENDQKAHHQDLKTNDAQLDSATQLL